MSKHYSIPVIYQSYGRVIIEAESLEDVIKKINDPDFIADMELPLNPEYVEDSYQIDLQEDSITQDVISDHLIELY